MTPGDISKSLKVIFIRYKKKLFSDEHRQGSYGIFAMLWVIEYKSSDEKIIGCVKQYSCT